MLTYKSVSYIKLFNVITKVNCYFLCSVVTLKLYKEYLNAVTSNIPALLQMKNWTVWYMDCFYMSTHVGVTNFDKNSPVF